jgi:hypothetical protein
MTTHVNRAGAFANAFAALPDAPLLRWRAGKGASAKRADPADPSKTKYKCGCSNAWGKPGLAMRCLLRQPIHPRRRRVEGAALTTA